MRLQSKNKGFTLIELIVVVLIIGIVMAIVIGNTGEQRQKAQLEETAGAIRDYLIEAGAVASKINSPIFITRNNGVLIANRANVQVAAGGATTLSDSGSPITNWEGGTGHEKLVNLANIDSLTIRGYAGANNHLFGAPDNRDKHLTLSNNGGNEFSHLLIRPMGPAFANDGNLAYGNLQQLNNDGNKGFIVVRKGMFATIIELTGTHTINMYNCHLAPNQDPLEGRYYTAK